MEYRYIATCLRCGETREIEFIKPEKPCPNCGDCFMHEGQVPVTRIEIEKEEN